MNCAEFQKILPEYMESGGSPEARAHLASCAVCSDLLQDLQYIAEAAKLLLPMEEPSPHVWQDIQKSLEKEGIAAEKLARVYAPVGIDIGAITPEEIAVAIVAELIAIRRNSQAALPHMKSTKAAEILKQL